MTEPKAMLMIMSFDKAAIVEDVLGKLGEVGAGNLLTAYGSRELKKRGKARNLSLAKWEREGG